VKRMNLNRKELAYISNTVCMKLREEDLSKWQTSCKALAPPNYDNTTRAAWFTENKYRIPVGKRIVDFVEEITGQLQRDDNLQKVRLSAIRSGIVKGIRDAEKEQKLSKYLLNEVKLSALKTLVRWSENPDQIDLEDGSRHKSMKNRRYGRKKEKGKYVQPRVDLVKEWELIDGNVIRLMLVVSNDFIHPYQNIELELELDSSLIVARVTPYSWMPEERKIRIGFLEASLGMEVCETQIVVEMRIKKKQRKFRIAAKVHYDNCDKGIRDVFALEEHVIEVS